MLKNRVHGYKSLQFTYQEEQTCPSDLIPAINAFGVKSISIIYEHRMSRVTFFVERKQRDWFWSARVSSGLPTQNITNIDRDYSIDEEEYSKMYDNVSVALQRKQIVSNIYCNKDFCSVCVYEAISVDIGTVEFPLSGIARIEAVPDNQMCWIIGPYLRADKNEENNSKKGKNEGNLMGNKTSDFFLTLMVNGTIDFHIFANYTACIVICGIHFRNRALCDLVSKPQPFQCLDNSQLRICGS